MGLVKGRSLTNKPEIPEVESQEAELLHLYETVTLVVEDSIPSRLLMNLNKSSHRRCSIKRGVLRNFAKFAEKLMCQSLFYNKVAGLI